MPRFIKQTDYNGYIKPEIFKVVTGATDDTTPSQAQIRAEDTAISTITEYLGGRYDCSLIFTAHTSGEDLRNKHIIKCVLDLAIYFLCQQTGMKDIPEHRKVNYDDTISWLKDAGRGTIKTTLPVLPENDPTAGDIRFNSREPKNHKW